MPIVSLRYRIPSPIGKLEILKDDPRVAIFLLSVAPNIKVALAAAGLGLARTLKPRVLIRGVIDDQLADDVETTSMSFPQKDFKILHGAVIRVDIGVIGNVVAIISQWRRIKGEEPDGRHAEVAKIIELFGQPGEIADAVCVTITKCSDVKLVNDRILVPERVFLDHRLFAFLGRSAHDWWLVSLLPVVIEILLPFGPAAQAENVRRHNLRVELNIDSRTVEQIARVGQQIV